MSAPLLAAGLHRAPGTGTVHALDSRGATIALLPVGARCWQDVRTGLPVTVDVPEHLSCQPASDRLPLLDVLAATLGIALTFGAIEAAWLLLW